MLLGDTSARVGNDKDDKIITNDKEEEWHKMPREENEDNYVNLNGQIVFQWARNSCNMFIMNGRTWPNEFTFQQRNDKSDVKPRRPNCDTCIAIRPILEHSSGKLKDPPLSDHNIIKVSIRIKREARSTPAAAFKSTFLKHKQRWRINRQQHRGLRE